MTIRVGEVPSPDTPLKEKVPTQPDITYLYRTAPRGVPWEVVKCYCYAFYLKCSIGCDCNIGVTWGCALGEGVSLQHEAVLFGAVDGDVEVGFESSVAPDMVEVSVGVEDRDGMGGVLYDPLRCVNTWVDNEIFSSDGDDITVGLVGSHRLPLDLHGIIPYGFLQ